MIIPLKPLRLININLNIRAIALNVNTQYHFLAVHKKRDAAKHLFIIILFTNLFYNEFLHHRHLAVNADSA